MHKRDPLSQFRDFTSSMENRVHTLAESCDVENLAGPRGSAVMYPRDNPDKEIYIKDIEKRLRISKSATSNLIKRMEKNGFIQAISSREDKRYKRVVLTEPGESKVQDIQDFHDEMHRQVLVDVDYEDLKIPFRIFDHILKSLENKE